MLLVSSLAVFAIMVGMAAAPASAATYNASVTIHARLCPTGGPTTDIFIDCHSHPAWTGTAYKINGHGSKVINGSGNVTFSGLGAATRTITQTAGFQPNKSLHVRAFCSANGGAAKEDLREVKLLQPERALLLLPQRRLARHLRRLTHPRIGRIKTQRGSCEASRRAREELSLALNTGRHRSAGFVSILRDAGERAPTSQQKRVDIYSLIYTTRRRVDFHKSLTMHFGLKVRPQDETCSPARAMIDYFYGAC